jgi:hypothetical protein
VFVNSREGRTVCKKHNVMFVIALREELGGQKGGEAE